MQPQTNTVPTAAADDSDPRSKTPGRGRPRALDDAKRREICALVAGGCGLREAAKYVGCAINTIRREADRIPAFHDQLRRSEMYAQLSPLKAMQHAVGTHWRAAAWMLERAFPDRFARPEPGAFGARHARQLLSESLQVISSEISDPIKYERIEKRIRGTFEYYIRSACDRRRNTSNLRRAMQFFEEKNQHTDPLAQFGITMPDFDTLMNPTTPGRKPDPERDSPRAPASTSTPSEPNNP